MVVAYALLSKEEGRRMKIKESGESIEHERITYHNILTYLKNLPTSEKPTSVSCSKLTFLFLIFL